MQGRDGDDGRFEEDLGRALRRAEDEARPREEFARGLRERFVSGSLAPAGESPAPAAPARLLPFPGWILVPAAAAVLLAAFALPGVLGSRPSPETPAPPGPPGTVETATGKKSPEPPAPPAAPTAPALTPVEEAFAAAERRIAAAPELAGRTWQRRVVEGRAWLLPAEIAFADAGELKTLGLYASQASSVLAAQFPALAARPALPPVAVVAPSRRAFESLVAPKIDPAPLGEFTIAFHLADLGVLLVAPSALDPGGPPCEEMYVVHEGAHEWLRSRLAPGASLPLWVDEGLAGIVAESGGGAKRWCRQVLTSVASHGLDPFDGAQVLGLGEYGEMARRVAAKAPCEERPYSLLPVFYAHAESLVLFLGEDHPACVHRAAFEAWLLGALEGRATGAEETAKALGFESVEALFRARDEWLRK